jgi:ADP-ribose pyrophosphatase
MVLVYLAEGLRDVDLPDGFTVEHEEADMTLDRVPLTDAVQRIFDGDIRNASAVIGLLAVAQARATAARLRSVDAQ